jgi:hypothetical protein
MILPNQVNDDDGKNTRPTASQPEVWLSVPA